MNSDGVRTIAYEFLRDHPEAKERQRQHRVGPMASGKTYWLCLRHSVVVGEEHWQRDGRNHLLAEWILYDITFRHILIL
jgi:hypothetical protein